MKLDFPINIITLLAAFIPLVFRLTWDYITIVKLKQYVNHTGHSVVTGILMLTLSYIIFQTDPLSNIFQPLLLQWAIYWLFFDYSLNLLRGKHFFYTSGFNTNSSWFDRKIYSQIPIQLVITAKVWFAIVAFCVYYYWSYI